MAQASGYYYDMEGLLVGKIGNEKKIILCLTSKKNKIMKDGKEIVEVEFIGSFVPQIPFADFLEMAATTFGESSSHINGVTESDLKSEALALAYSIMNYKHKRNHDQQGGYKPTDINQLCTDMKAYASGKQPYKDLKKAFNADPLKLNGTKMQNHTRAAIFAHVWDNPDKIAACNVYEALNTVMALLKQALFDYAYGAIFWDGVDLKTSGVGHAKRKAGYLISDEKHNVMGITSNKLVPPKKLSEGTYYRDENGKIIREHHEYEYKFVTTCGFAKSTFVKFSDDFERAMRKSPWSKDGGIYKLHRWW